jgi:type IV secretory pathway TrbL component
MSEEQGMKLSEKIEQAGVHHMDAWRSVPEGTMVALAEAARALEAERDHALFDRAATSILRLAAPMRGGVNIRITATTTKVSGYAAGYTASGESTAEDPSEAVRAMARDFIAKMDRERKRFDGDLREFDRGSHAANEFARILEAKPDE